MAPRTPPLPDTPDPEPEPEPDRPDRLPPDHPVDECYLRLLDDDGILDLEPGINRFDFEYFVGNPPMAAEFGIIWYGSEQDRENDHDPITDTRGIPEYWFNPVNPFPDHLNVLTAEVVFNIPRDEDYAGLYPELVLLRG